MSEQRVVIVGAGFGGYFAARELRRRLRHRAATITVVSDTDGMLYQPLLPDVAVGALDARDIMVPLHKTLAGVRVVRGHVENLDLDARTVQVTGIAGAEEIGYDHLVLAVGGVTKLLDIDGLADHAIGFKTPAEALYLRDHVLGQLEAADVETDARRRRALLTFVVVGAGYAGTELTAQMARLTRNLLPNFPTVQQDELNWLLLDVAPKVMPELGESLGDTAVDLLRRRGVDVRLETSLTQVTAESVTLTDGTQLDCATVIWCAGVTANPLIATLDLPTVKGRLVVDATLQVPGHPEVLALGDAAAVPDITKPAGDDGTPALCPPTAQHAMRQGRAAARNVSRRVKGKPVKPYKHHDLGLVVDLGGPDAAAKPLGIDLRGRTAKVVTRGYHVAALPTVRRRLRVLSGWALAGRTPDDVSFGMIPMQTAREEHRSGASS